MPQQRDTATDRLLNVIQVLQLGRKSGLLTVERGEGAEFEEGVIVFANGQVTHAETGQNTGLEAFNWLSAWGACRFAFVPELTSSMVTSPLPPLSQNGSAPPPADTGARMRAQRAASNRQSQAPPFPDTGARMRAQRTSGNERTPTSPLRNTNSRMQAHQPVLNGLNGRPNFQLGAADSRSMRTKQLEDGLRLLEQAHLTRTHRNLYLLIDGSRSMAELVRLMGREEHEVQALLYELAEAGLIQL
jgi:hypothetical protein